MLDKDNWDDILNGYEGDTYRKEVMIPTILKLLPDLKGKSVLDAGTGNGILIPHLSKLNPKTVVGIDISEDLLSVARERLPKNLKFYKRDLTKELNLEEGPFDLVISNLVLNEIEDIDAALRNISGQIKKGGQLILGLLHPAYVLGKFCFGDKNIEGFKDYFTEGGIVEIYKDGAKSIRFEAFFHQISSYLNAVIKAGLQITEVVEPKMPEKVTRDNPYYGPYKALPITLYIVAKK